MITCYDQKENLLAVLENADAVGYMLKDNDLWTASIALPGRDPKNRFLQPHNFVKISDGPRNLGLFRILGIPDDPITDPDAFTEYQLEHASATLIDDILFGYHEIGGPGADTAGVISYILEHQTQKRWRLGRCDFHEHFSYKFENATLLGALFSLSQVLTTPFEWVFDTEHWQVSLIQADSEPSCGMFYARNIQEITRTVDASTLITRLYLLGYGEGVNQLTVNAVNGGLPYIDADTLPTYGVKASCYCDPRIEDARTLLARGRQMLEKLKMPRITYTVSAIDLAMLTGEPFDTFMPGKIVAVHDDADGVNFEARITCVEKTDAYGDPGDIRLTIASSPMDIADSINALADRQGIHDLYAQGATNLYSQQFADNADSEHPATMRVYIPHGCVRINQMLLSWQLSPFRAYETGAAAGGGTISTTTSGGGSTVTSSSGGASERTSASGGNYAQTLPQTTTTTAAYTGGTIVGEGDTSGRTGAALSGDGTVRTETDDYTGYTSGGGSTQVSTSDSSRVRTDSGGGHSHSTNAHDHGINGGRTTKSAPNTAYASGHSHEITHTHTVNINHRHAMTHRHNMAHIHSMQHRHKVTCTVTIPAQDVTVPAHTHTFRTASHTHNVTVPVHTHNVTVPVHTHAIQYGIHEGTTARSIKLIVDGQEVPEISGTEMDIIQWLRKDDAGRVTRGAWHTIQLKPDTLTRIDANVFVQAFIQSRGGGDY